MLWCFWFHVARFLGKCNAITGLVTSVTRLFINFYFSFLFFKRCYINIICYSIKNKQITLIYQRIIKKASGVIVP